MEGSGCDLAAEINGKPYFVVGSGIDDHGDAHSAHGFCNAIRDAKVRGVITDGKFHAESITLLKDEADSQTPEG